MKITRKQLRHLILQETRHALHEQDDLGKRIKDVVSVKPGLRALSRALSTRGTDDLIRARDRARKNLENAGRALWDALTEAHPEMDHDAKSVEIESYAITGLPSRF